MAINEKLLDEQLANYKTPEDIIGEDGLLKQMTKALLERAMNAELSQHLGFAKHDPAGYNSWNSRNGKAKKTLKATSARSNWRRHATGTAASSRRSSARGKPASPGLTTRSSRCIDHKRSAIHTLSPAK
jgi:hypothetical protein